jgi:hypothetical protein
MNNWRTTLAWQVEQETDPDLVQHNSYVLAKKIVDGIAENFPQLLIDELDKNITPGDETLAFDERAMMAATKRYLKQYIDTIALEDIFAQ